MRLGMAMRGVTLAGVSFGAALVALALAPASASADENENGSDSDSDNKRENDSDGKGDPQSAEGSQERTPVEKPQPPRPPLPSVPPAEPPPWERHIEIGADIALVSRPATTIGDGILTGVRYRPAIGFGIQGSWDVFRYLRFTGYFVSANHRLALPAGSLDQRGVIETDAVGTFVFGARLSPTLRWSERARTWITAGMGWGRLNFERMQVKEPPNAPFTVRERSASFVEVPLGIGTSFDIVPRWLAIKVEVTGAFVLNQEGTAVHSAQAIDGAGKIRSIGILPVLDASLVQTIGLSLIL